MKTHSPRKSGGEHAKGQGNIYILYVHCIHYRRIINKTLICKIRVEQKDEEVTKELMRKVIEGLL
jgi:hypothetical protein